MEVITTIDNTQNLVTKAFSKEEIELIKKQFFPKTASEVDINYCFGVAKQYGLSPILKQIFFVSRRAKNENNQWIDKVEPLVGRDGFLSIAHRTGVFGGMESSCEIKSIPQMTNGKWGMIEDLIATCKVFRKDTTTPFVVEVSYREYVQTKSDGTPTQFWASKPQTMLKKVAESQALRKAFDIAGLYAPEEVGVGVSDNGEIVYDTEVVNPNVPNLGELNFIDVYRDLKLLNVGLKLRDEIVEAIGNTIVNAKMLRDFGFSYKNKTWSIPRNCFVESSLRAFGTAKALDNACISFENKLVDNVLWFKVDSVNDEGMALLAELGFTKPEGKDFYTLKVA